MIEAHTIECMKSGISACTCSQIESSRVYITPAMVTEAVFIAESSDDDPHEVMAKELNRMLNTKYG